MRPGVLMLGTSTITLKRTGAGDMHESRLNSNLYDMMTRHDMKSKDILFVQ